MLENKFSHTAHSLNDESKLLPLPPKCLAMWFYLQFALEVLQNGGGYEPTHSTSIDTENGEPFPSVPLGLLSQVLDRHFANYDWFPPTLSFFLLQKPGKTKTKEQDVVAEGELPADEAVVASAEVENQWGWRDLWSLLAADDTCMVYLKENNRPNPTTCNTCAGPTVFTAQFCKSASQAPRLSLSLILLPDLSLSLPFSFSPRHLQQLHAT